MNAFSKKSLNERNNEDFLSNQINQYSNRVAELEVNLEKATFLASSKIREAEDWKDKFFAATNQSRTEPRHYEDSPEKEVRGFRTEDSPRKVSDLINENDELKKNWIASNIQLFAAKCELLRLSDNENNQHDKEFVKSLEYENKQLRDQIRSQNLRTQHNIQDRPHMESLEKELQNISESYEILLKEYETQKSIDKPS